MVKLSALDERSCSELLRTVDCMLRRRTGEMYLSLAWSAALQVHRRVLPGPSICWREV